MRRRGERWGRQPDRRSGPLPCQGDGPPGSRRAGAHARLSACVVVGAWFRTPRGLFDPNPKTVVRLWRYRGSNPPSPLQKAKNGGSRPGPHGRVFASFRRVRGQLGDKLASTKRTKTDSHSRVSVRRAGHQRACHQAPATLVCPTPHARVSSSGLRNHSHQG